MFQDAGLQPLCENPLVVTRDLAERTKDCRLERGSTIIMYYSPEDLAAEHAVLSETPGGAVMPNVEEEVGKLGSEGFEDEPRVERKSRQLKHKEPEQEQLQEEVVEEVEAPAPVTAPPTKATHSVVGVAAPEVDVKKIVDESAGATPYTVMLALIAVVGGGAGWKFYQNFAKQKHEQAMKALEVEQSRVDKQQSDHQACSAKSAALAAQVESLSAKLTQLESKVTTIPDASPDLGFSKKDFDKLSKRMKDVEKKLQPAKQTTTNGSAGE